VYDSLFLFVDQAKLPAMRCVDIIGHRGTRRRAAARCPRVANLPVAFPSETERADS